MNLSIRDLQKRKDILLQEYHTRVDEIDAQISEIRKARGTKIKTPEGGRYYEVGRDREPTRG